MKKEKEYLVTAVVVVKAKDKREARSEGYRLLMEESDTLAARDLEVVEIKEN